MYFALLFLQPLCWLWLNFGCFYLIFLILAKYTKKKMDGSAAEAIASVTSMCSVGLVVTLAATAMPSADKYATDAAAAELLSQSEQILVAINKRSVSAKGDLTNLQQLVAHHYLSSMPTPASGPYAEVAAKDSDWWLLAPGMQPAVILQDKIDTATCRTLNSKLGVEGIKSQPDASRRIQCFGAASPYTLMLNPSGKVEVLVPAIGSWNRCVADPTRPG